MRSLQFVKAALVAAAVFSTAAAQASLLNFDLTGGYTAHWQMDTASTKPSNDAVGYSIEYHDIQGNFPGANDRAEIDFYDVIMNTGGFTISDYQRVNILADVSGPQLYLTNTEDDPVFTLGTFNFTDGTQDYTLMISDAEASAVPEPATVALLAGGFGLMFAARKRRHGK